MIQSFTVVQRQPCPDCPFRRSKRPGFLGKYTPEEVLAHARSSSGFPCQRAAQAPLVRPRQSTSKCMGALHFAGQPLDPNCETHDQLVHTAAEFLDQHPQYDEE